jgi:hypothetical protein
MASRDHASLSSSQIGTILFIRTTCLEEPREAFGLTLIGFSRYPTGVTAYWSLALVRLAFTIMIMHVTQTIFFSLCWAHTN